MTIRREVRLAADIVYGSSSENRNQDVCVCEHVKELQDRMTKAHEVARKYLQKKSRKEQRHLRYKNSAK